MRDEFRELRNALERRARKEFGPQMRFYDRQQCRYIDPLQELQKLPLTPEVARWLDYVVKIDSEDPVE